jgi:hypothetical protein
MESQMRQAANQTDLVRAHRTVNPNSAVALEKHYSVPELAKIWFLSENTVRRIFLEEPGVLKLPHKETRHKEALHDAQNSRTHRSWTLSTSIL